MDWASYCVMLLSYFRCFVACPLHSKLYTFIWHRAAEHFSENPLDSEPAVAIVTSPDGTDGSDYIVDDMVQKADENEFLHEIIEDDYGDSASDADNVESASFSLSSVVSQSTSNFILYYEFIADSTHELSALPSAVFTSQISFTYMSPVAMATPLPQSKDAPRVTLGSHNYISSSETFSTGLFHLFNE